jgi:hypothetical protein
MRIIDTPGILVVMPLLVLAGAGCTTTVSAASSRFVATDSASQPSSPLCFTPLDAGPGLADRAQAEHLKELCESAAKKLGVSIVPFDSPSCMVAATMIWHSKPTGQVVEDCSPAPFYTVNCTGSMVHGKTLRVSMNQKSGGKQLSETVSRIDSDFAAITDNSVFALCSAAFYRYPTALRNEHFSVPVEN